MWFVSAQLFPNADRRVATMTDQSLLGQMFRVSEYMRVFRIEMRFGRLSRAPLRLIRFEVQNNSVECDWLARRPDSWDVNLPLRIQHRHASLEALRDAIEVRAMLFELMPQAASARLRVYREADGLSRELIINGCADRTDRLSRAVHSLAMRAKTLGFHFDLDGDHLRSIASAREMDSPDETSLEPGNLLLGRTFNRGQRRVRWMASS